MEKAFWNNRFTGHKTVYGEAPNFFFKQFIDAHQPGAILLPAEGEGRNAVYAAEKGWQVDAFDFSEVAREKALQRAGQKAVNIHYTLQEVEHYRAQQQYDAVGLIYVHLPENSRKAFHKEVCAALKPGGYVVLEAFAKEQLQYSSGGPKDAALLYDPALLRSDFSALHLITCVQKEVTLDEGPFHQGKAVVVQLIGQKL